MGKCPFAFFITNINRLDLLTEISELEEGRKFVITGDGEPLMNKAFFDMVRLAKQRQIWIMIASNGSTFSTSNVKKICESGLDYIGISIDSADPETFAQFRTGGNLQQVLKGIKRLSSYRDEHGYKYPLLGVRGISFKQSQEQLVEIVQLAKEHGVDVVDTFQPLNPKVSYLEHYPKEKKAWLDTRLLIISLFALGNVLCVFIHSITFREPTS